MATDGKKMPGSKTFEPSEFKAKKLKLPFGRHRDKIRILGDIVSPSRPTGSRSQAMAGTTCFDSARHSWILDWPGKPEQSGHPDMTREFGYPGHFARTDCTSMPKTV